MVSPIVTFPVADFALRVVVDRSPAAALLTPVAPLKLIEVFAVTAPVRFTAPNVDVRLNTSVVIVPAGFVSVPPELTETELLPVTVPLTTTFAAADPSALSRTLVPLIVPFALIVPVVEPPFVVSSETFPLAPTPVLLTPPVTVMSFPKVFKLTVLPPCSVNPAPIVVVPLAVVVRGALTISVPVVSVLGAPAIAKLKLPVPFGAIFTAPAVILLVPFVPTVLLDELSRICNGVLLACDAMLTVDPPAFRFVPAPMSLNCTIGAVMLTAAFAPVTD